MTALSRLADLLRRVNSHTDAIRTINQTPFQADDLDGTIIRVRTGDDTYYLELRPLRSAPVADITFDGVFVQPAIVFWPRWLIYDADAELAMVVKVEESVAH